MWWTGRCCLYPLRDTYYNVFGCGRCNSYLNYVVAGLVAVLWLTTTLSCSMDIGGVCFRKPPYTLPLLRVSLNLLELFWSYKFARYNMACCVAHREATLTHSIQVKTRRPTPGNNRKRASPFQRLQTTSIPTS